MVNLTTPKFNKSDRYKASGYRASNQKMPDIYDDCILLKVFQVETFSLIE